MQDPRQQGSTFQIYEVMPGRETIFEETFFLGVIQIDRLEPNTPELDVTFDLDAYLDLKVQIHTCADHPEGIHQVAGATICGMFELEEAELCAHEAEVNKLAEMVRRGESEEHAKHMESCRFFFVDAKKLRESSELILAPFSSLQEAHWLVEHELTWSEVCSGSLVGEYLAVSHRWDQPELPDSTGQQLRAVRDFLRRVPSIRYVWYDGWCLPQGKRSKEEQALFDRSLPHINLLYLGCTVLVLMDLSYISRFWTLFESWLAMSSTTAEGLVPAEYARGRCHITCIHSARSSTDALTKLLVQMWTDKQPNQVYDLLAATDIVVTNVRDKQVQLPKVLKISANVNAFFREQAKHS